jgi:cation transport regulator
VSYGLLEGCIDCGDESLPRRARDIYEEMYSSAWEQYESDLARRDNASLEETARRIAWTAVKQLYKKDETTGIWQKCQTQDWTTYDEAKQIIS